MTDQKPNPQDDLREIAEVLETDSHYSGSDESKRRAGYAATLRAHAAAMDAARPVAWIDSLSLDWLAQERAKNNRNAGAPVYAIQPIRTLPLYTHPPASEVVEVWQQIETAPANHDGRGMLLYGYLMDDLPDPPMVVFIGSRPYPLRNEQANIFERIKGSGLYVCSHWMPLPQPPKEKRRARR